MIRKKIIPVLIAIGMLPGLLAACGDIGGKEVPTGTPSTSLPGEGDEPDTKVPDKGDEPDTEVPDKGFTSILELDGEEEAQLSSLSAEGGQLSLKKKAYQGAASICFSKRTSLLQGIELNFVTRENEWVNVIGKKAYIGVWVYHTSGKEEKFSCTLLAKTMENELVYPVVKEQQVPSGIWTLLETFMEVPADVKSPVVRITMPSSDVAFYMDELRLSYDPSSKVGDYVPPAPSVADNPNSNVPVNPDFEDEVIKDITRLIIDFEDSSLPFTGSGSAVVSTVKGGHDSAKCLRVNKRNSAKDGAQIHLDKYNLAGKKFTISYWVYHESTFPIDVSLCAQKAGSTEAERITVVEETKINAGKWVKLTGTISFETEETECFLFFESTDRTATFYLDDFVMEPVQ